MDVQAKGMEKWLLREKENLESKGESADRGREYRFC